MRVNFGTRGLSSVSFGPRGARLRFQRDGRVKAALYGGTGPFRARYEWDVSGRRKHREEVVIYLSAAFLLLSVIGLAREPTMGGFALARLGFAWFLSALSKRLSRRMLETELEHSLSEIQTGLRSLQSEPQDLSRLADELRDSQDSTHQPPPDRPAPGRYGNVVPFPKR